MAADMTSTRADIHPATVRMSYEEYLSLPDDVRAEWKDGEVNIFMPPKKHHQRVVKFLYALLDLFVQALQLGEVGIAPFEVKLGPEGPSREPDLFFVATTSLDRWTDDRLEGAPDLAVEVISRDSVGRDRGDKRDEYEEAGVREYWLIDPRPGKERAEFYVLDAAGRFQLIQPDEHDIFHSHVLPGFALHLAWLWQDPAPSALQILAELARRNPALAAALRRSIG
jgi:Uma2 family endonuclease